MKEENKVSEAVKVIYKRVRFWEHPKFHEAMSNQEIINMAEDHKFDNSPIINHGRRAESFRSNQD